MYMSASHLRHTHTRIIFIYLIWHLTKTFIGAYNIQMIKTFYLVTKYSDNYYSVIYISTKNHLSAAMPFPKKLYWKNNWGPRSRVRNQFPHRISRACNHQGLNKKIESYINM